MVGSHSVLRRWRGSLRNEKEEKRRKSGDGMGTLL
jgi:hypothetical protein